MENSDRFMAMKSPVVFRSRPRGRAASLTAAVRKLATITLLFGCFFSGLAGQLQASHERTLFLTRFEATEGYSIEFDLAGQNSWVAFGSDSSVWNGLVTKWFGLTGEDLPNGQQAYLGFAAPTLWSDYYAVSLWRPLQFDPAETGETLVIFSALMAIVDSTTTQRDDFRWSVYNAAGQRLFSLDFDNASLEINYALDDDAGFVNTGKTFTNDFIYELQIEMDFARNVWSAFLHGDPLVEEQPITTRGAELTLGDIDAVWFLHQPGAAGDNYMIFDDYWVTVERPAVPLSLQIVERLSDGRTLLKVTGEPAHQYVIEASPNLVDWTPIKTNSPTDGTFEFLDTAAPQFDRRFYRARDAGW
jgi:hypothetical protein